MERIRFYSILVAVLLLLSSVVYGETFTDSFDNPVFTNSNWATATDVQQSWSFPALSGSDLGYHVSTTNKEVPGAMAVNKSTSYNTANLYVEMLLGFDSHVNAYSSENMAGIAIGDLSGEMYVIAIQLDFDGSTEIDLQIHTNDEDLTRIPVSISFDTFYKMIVHIDSNNIMAAYLYSLDGSLLGYVSTGSALSINSGTVNIFGMPEVTFDDFSLTTNTDDQVIPDIPVIWPQNRHDAKNTGYSPYAGPSTGSLKWQFLLPSTVLSASPVIGADGTIYISNGQSGSGGVYAINPDGSQKWLYPGHSSGSAPAISTDGTVYMPGYRNFNAINPDGTLKWSYTAQNVFSYTSPTIGQDGTIYIGCDIDLLALSPGGTLLWQYRVGEEINSTPAVASDGTIYVRSKTEYLCAVNPNGSQKWKLKLGSNTYGSGMSPVIAADGTIYTNGISSYSYGPNYPDFEYNALYAINPDGTTKWVFNSISPAGVGPGGFGAALDSTGNIYLGGRMNEDQHTNAFFALNSSGALLWSYPMPPTDYFGKSSPIIDVNGVIYFGATNYLYALNSNGTLKWKFPTDIDGSSPAIGSNGTLYFGSKDGYLNAIGNSNGGELPTSLTQTQISQLYVSIFNRASEGDGNSFWQSLPNIATAAAAMLDTDAAKNYFGSSLDTDQAFIEHIYLNTLNKSLSEDPGGIAYWVGLLSQGYTRGQVVAFLVGVIGDYAPGGPSYNPNDAVTIAAYNQFTNRVEVSDYMADTVQGTPINWETATAFSSGLIVTDDPATVVTAKAVVDLF